MGVPPSARVSRFAALAAVLLWVVVAAPAVGASPTPDPAPTGITPTPDPVGASPPPPRAVNQTSPSQRATTRRARTTNTTARSSRTPTVPRSSQSTRSAGAATTPSGPKAAPRKQVSATPAQPIVVTPAVLPIAVHATGDRDGDLVLGAAIALGALVLASLALVALSRRMQTTLRPG